MSHLSRDYPSRFWKVSILPGVLFVLLGLAAAFSGPPLAGNRALPGDDPVQGAAPSLGDFIRISYPADEGTLVEPGRLIVILNTAVTDELLVNLSGHGVVHGWIDRYRLVAMTPTGPDRAVVAALPYVEYVETDAPAYPAAVGSWDRDIIDGVDVEESGTAGDPDYREVRETGIGVHVAVIDSGLDANWRDVLPEDRIDTSLARAFTGGEGGGVATVPPRNEFNDATGLWERDTCGHGTAVTSEVVGFKHDALEVDGIAPGATIIPLKAFSSVGPQGCSSNLSRVLAAIDYVIGLVEAGTVGPTVINMSFAFFSPEPLLERAMNEAVAAGIVLVAAAGNRADQSLTWPGAYPPVISAGAIGWTKQFRSGDVEALNLDFWWTQDVGFDPDPRHGSAEESEAFVAPFSGRAYTESGQELDLLAPGYAVMCPFPRADLRATGDTFLLLGTSMASPLVAGTAALMLEKNPALTPAGVEAILKSAARPMNRVDSRTGVLNFFFVRQGNELVPVGAAETTISWDDDCAGVPCDPVGAGLLDADAALDAVPEARRERPGGLAVDRSATMPPEGLAIGEAIVTTDGNLGWPVSSTHDPAGFIDEAAKRDQCRNTICTYEGQRCCVCDWQGVVCGKSQMCCFCGGCLSPAIKCQIGCAP